MKGQYKTFVSPSFTCSISIHISTSVPVLFVWCVCELYVLVRLSCIYVHH